MKHIQFKLVETEHDINTLFDIIKVVWPEVFTDILGEEQVNYMVKNYQSIEKIEKEIAAGVQYYIVTLAGEAVGYLAFDIEAEHLYISKFYLLDTVRGQGVSRQMMTWLAEVALANDRQKLFLHVNRMNARAISVYQHFGFETVKSVDTAFGVYSLNDYWMEKQLVE